MGDSIGIGGGGTGGADILTALPPALAAPDLASPRRAMLSCVHCARPFTKRSKLDEHLKAHSDQRSFPCPQPGCTSSYKRSDHLQRHILRSHGSAPPSTPGTPLTTGSPIQPDLNSPVEAGSRSSSAGLYDPARPFACTFVPRESTSANVQPCGRRFWSKQHLQRHLEGFHDVEPQGLDGEESKEDDDEENSGQARHGKKRGKGRHRAGGQGAYVCDQPLCDAVFSKRKQLRAHIWAAHSELPKTAPDTGDTSTLTKPALPFKCSHEDCGKRFATNAKRRAHMRTHDGERYTCFLDHTRKGSAAGEKDSPKRIGPMRFRTWTALQKHMREAHPPTCPYPRCKGKTFARPENLRIHLQRHEEKARELQRSGREGDDSDDEGMALEEEDWDDEDDEEGQESHPSSSRALQVHICGWQASPSCGGAAAGVSPSSEPYGKKFKSAYARAKHISVHHKRERPFSCPAAPRCGKAYGHKHLLKRHLNRCKLAQRLTKEGGSDVPTEATHEEAPQAYDADPDEEEDEDAYFLREDGAVPGEDSERGPTRQARQSKLKRKRGAEAQRLVELLTGRGYAERSEARDAQEEEEEEAEGEGRKKRRRMRGRVLACPWDTIEALRRSAVRVGGTASQDVEDDADEEEGEPRGCAFRFSRLYDLRRHLSSKHGLDLDEAELRSVVPRQQQLGLAKPRVKKQAQ